MENFFIAAHFFKALLKPDKSFKAKSIQLKSHEYTLMADVYKPNERSSKGVLLFVHGMTPYGYRDERMIDLGRAAVKCGYTAIIPSFPLIKQGLIDTSSIDRVVFTVAQICNDRNLCEKGSLGIFTASFSGSICIRAASDASVRDKISGIMIVGGCNNPKQTFNDIMTSPNQDRYAKLILLKNLAIDVLEKNQSLTNALNCAIEDEYNNNHQSYAYKSYLSHLDIDTRNEVMNFIDPILRGQSNPNTIFEKQYLALDQAFKQRQDYKNIHCPVFLAHSKTDNVIPPKESQDLYNELIANSVKCKILITPLLGHAGITFNFKIVARIWRLLSLFNQFFLTV